MGQWGCRLPVIDTNAVANSTNQRAVQQSNSIRQSKKSRPAVQQQQDQLLPPKQNVRDERQIAAFVEPPDWAKVDDSMMRKQTAKDSSPMAAQNVSVGMVPALVVGILAVDPIEIHLCSCLHNTRGRFEGQWI